MSRATTKAIIRMMVEELNEEVRIHFEILREGKRNYSKPQQEYALSLVETHGVRATSRILQIPRRTIQRWCRQRSMLVKRCPDWVYEWAETTRKRREFWERRGYSY